MKIITLSLCAGVLFGAFYYDIIILVPRTPPSTITPNNIHNSTINTLIAPIQKVLGPTIICQSAIIDNNILYLSCDTIPVSSEKSFYESILRLQEILTVIHTINSSITAVYFLHNHRVISNHKIDFTVPILINSQTTLVS